eukprot:CAMPEP_0181125182 /NCGR_PEP_ID=MMETSP1071-20121207/26897_1 /TAXON_ID=35127 /ORGANISM="Thalassiosira sp., Strain NH16" /LENGTH=513 /DNA_ID=CAMNT_0023210575 /DNA_START=9 /DNA_END=1550 /DNA_ORIENTATION=+
MMNQDNPGLPLGAQHQQTNCQGCDDDDAEEKEHFQQVVSSYQQYATFHQTRQQGVNRRMQHLLRASRRDDASPDGVSEADGGVDAEMPTIESIMPPALLPQTVQNQQYQKQFCDASIRNQFFLDNVLKYSGSMTSQEVLRHRREQGNNRSDAGTTEWVTEDKISKIDSVLKSLSRDWSREGLKERSIVYDRMIGALERYMPLDSRDNGSDDVDELTDSIDQRLSPPPRVAVPGSGLGRLAWEIYSRGYSVQGSDFSLPMLLASDFMLNGCCAGEKIDGEDVGGGGSSSFKQFGICPWISETKNTTSFGSRIRTVAVPDVDPTALQCNTDGDNKRDAPEFTMMAGEFLHLYSRFLPKHQHDAPEPAEKFHAVSCSFFLDTAPSLPHYLLTIYHMLEEGGLLLHFGPLMYHWSGHGGLIPADVETPANSNGRRNSNGTNNHKRRNKHLDPRYLSSIDYTWEEVRYMILQCGFEIVEEEMHIPAHYTPDGTSMMKVIYDCVFLVARKKRRLPNSIR